MSEGYDVGQIYRGLVSYLRNMMIVKACGGVPDFISMGEEEKEDLKKLIRDIEYYEIQNMLYYMLRSEDLMRGMFPKIALETLYINLYNLSQLKDVDRVIAELDRANRHHPARHRAHTRPVQPMPAGMKLPCQDRHLRQRLTKGYRKFPAGRNGPK